MIRFFAGHPTAGNLLMLLIMVAGILSLSSLKRETFPEYNLGEVEVSAIYRGASAKEVEESVCLRMEDSLDTVPGIKEAECESREGFAHMVVKMDSGYKFDRFFTDVKTEIEAISDFPQELEELTIREKDRTDPVISIAVSAQMSYPQLRYYAEEMKNELTQLSDINTVKIVGTSDFRYRVRLDEAKLRYFGLSAIDVQKQILAQNVELPGGVVETSGREYLLRYMDQRKTPQELEELLIIAGQNGAEIPLKALASIDTGFEKKDEFIIFDGDPGIQLNVEMNNNEDALVVRNAVENYVKQKKKLLPSGIHLTLTQDVSSIVKDRLDMLLGNGIQGFVLVFLALYMFFGLRLSFWVAMGLPVSFLGAIFFMPMLGQTVNMLSMVGLLMAIGLLMDDAVVISENIAVHRSRGKSALMAAVDGTKEVLPGVLSSYLTTVGVFGGLMFLDGDLGRTFKAMPKALLLVMSVSLVEAFLILPHHLLHSLKEEEKKISKVRQLFERGFEWVRQELVEVVMKWCFHHKSLFLGSLLAILIVSVGMIAGGRLKFQALPDMDGDVIQARLMMNPGTPVKETQGVVKKLVDRIHEIDKMYTPQQPGGQHLIEHVSAYLGVNADANETGGHVATITVDLLSAEVRTVILDEIFQQWRKAATELTDVVSLSFKEPVLGPAGRPVHIRAYSHNLEDLVQVDQVLTKELNSYKGIYDVMGDLRAGKPEIRLKLKHGALELGVTSQMIISQLRSAFQGLPAGEVFFKEKAHELWVEINETDQKTLGIIDNFMLILADKRQIPLKNVVEITYSHGYSRINRIDGRRVLTVIAEVDPHQINVMEVLTEMKSTLFPELQKRFKGLNFEFDGQMGRVMEAQPSMKLALLLGLLCVFFVLSYQFGSWTEPLLIMSAVPLALIGVVWGHILMGMDLSMPSMVGFISLVGIVVNNSILLVQFIRMRQKEYDNLEQAVTAAVKERFRPIMITTLTTLAGMLPLLTERSMQAQILIPLVISVVFGLAVATVLVLLAVPCIYLLSGMHGASEEM